MARSTILVCGPSPSAVGGGPADVRSLWASPLAEQFWLELFETGSRGRESPARDEAPPTTLLRLLTSPFALAASILRVRPAVVHLNTSVDPRGLWREVVDLLVAKLLGCRVLYQIHGGSLERLTTPACMAPIARTGFRWPDALVELLLAGFGDARGRLAADIGRRGLRGAVRLVGPVQGEDTVAFLREADVFRLPSESEGLPYALIESLAAGTPVVASRVGGIPDVVVDREHGIPVQPRDPTAIAAALRELAAR